MRQWWRLTWQSTDHHLLWMDFNCDFMVCRPSASHRRMNDDKKFKKNWTSLTTSLKTSPFNSVKNVFNCSILWSHPPRASLWLLKVFTPNTFSDVTQSGVELNPGPSLFAGLNLSTTLLYLQSKVCELKFTFLVQIMRRWLLDKISLKTSVTSELSGIIQPWVCERTNRTELWTSSSTCPQTFPVNYTQKLFKKP